MKKFSYEILPDSGFVLMTTNEIDGESDLLIADFRDNKVIKYKPTGHFIGFSASKGLRLCKGPPKMINGIWIVEEDTSAAEKYKDIRLSADLLDFASIS